MKIQWDQEAFHRNEVAITSAMKELVENMISMNKEKLEQGINYVTFRIEKENLRTPLHGKIGIKKSKGNIIVTFVTRETEEAFFEEPIESSVFDQ